MLDVMERHVDLGMIDSRLHDLQRPRTYRYTSGLSQALADRLQIDVMLVRGAFVVLTLFSGLGLVIYAWATVLTRRPGQQSPMQRVLPQFGTWPLTFQGAIIALSSLLVVSPWKSWLAVLALAGGIGWVVWYQPRRSLQHATPEGDHPDELTGLGVVEEPVPPRPRDWAGTLRVIIAGTATFLLAGVSGATLGTQWQTMSIALAASSAVVGAILILRAITRSDQRLPTSVLVVALLLAAGTATSLLHESDQLVPLENTAPVADEVIVDEENYELDLSHVESGAIELRIIGSTVEITWPEDARIELSELNSQLVGEIPKASSRNPVLVSITAIDSTIEGVQP